MSGVSPELLDQVADEAPQTEMATIGPGQVDLLVQAAMGQSGVKRRCGPLDSVIPMFVELLGGVGGGRVEVPVGVGGPVRAVPGCPSPLAARIALWVARRPRPGHSGQAPAPATCLLHCEYRGGARLERIRLVPASVPGLGEAGTLLGARFGRPPRLGVWSGRWRVVECLGHRSLAHKGRWVIMAVRRSRGQESVHGVVEFVRVRS